MGDQADVDSQGLCESPRCPGEMDKPAAGAEQWEERFFQALEVHNRALQPQVPSGVRQKTQFALPSGVTEDSGRRGSVPPGGDVPALRALAVPAGQLCGTGAAWRRA